MISESPEEWARVERLLDRALDLAPEDRAGFLERECGQDATLRRRVNALLGALDAAGPFLERSASEVAAALVEELAERADAPPLERVGAYRLIHEVGRGGMGAVYLAERDDEQFRRQVAVKLVRAAAPDLTARFRAERQILASLDHPNIARLYDGGTAGSGVPYLVMEYIAGQRIDAWCDQRRLSVTARLRLFDTVCGAVEFAHQNLVVHRDLKPSNVLVSEDGVVKLLDFGIAKLLDPAGADDQPLTETGPRLLTPEYASPELLRGEPVSTATDVYALGVLLYELLSGRRPFELAGRSPGEIERIVAGTEPPKPSSVATEEASGRRGSSLTGLRRRVAGDLDNIALLALRREPERRYPSVHHLRDDVRHHLEGLPVAARPSTWAYRTGKLLRRHRVGAAAAALVALSLAGGLAATTWQARVAAREARRAGQVRDFLVGLFEGAAPDSALGRSVTAKELLDRGADRLQAGLADEPALRADMLRVAGRIYRELGLYPDARRLLEEALATHRRSGRPDDLAESAGELGSVLFEQGQFEAAESLAREALAVRRAGARGRAAPERLATTLAGLARILSHRGKAEEADSLYREALALDRRSTTPEGVAARLDAYGVSLWRAARYQDARQAEEEALALQRELYGSEHTAVATTLLNLATVHMDLGDFAAAERILRESLAIREKLLGPDHPDVAVAFNNLGNTLQRAGRLDEAETAQRRALAIRRAALGEEHPATVSSMNNLGVVLYYRSQYAEAAALFDRVVPRWRAAYGPRHARVLSALNNLGASLREIGDFDAAERVLRETLALRREAFGDEHPDVAQSHNNLARLLARRGAPAAAEASYRQAIAIWRRTLGDEHPNLASGLVDLGRLLLDEGRCRDAEPLLRQGVAIRGAALAPEAPLLANARLFLGECLIELGRPAEADTLVAAALAVLRNRWGDQAALTRRAQRVMDQLTTARNRRRDRGAPVGSRPE
jgi:serine/threonine-protein kinase